MRWFLLLLWVQRCYGHFLSLVFVTTGSLSPWNPIIHIAFVNHSFMAAFHIVFSNLQYKKQPQSSPKLLSLPHKLISSVMVESTFSGPFQGWWRMNLNPSIPARWLVAHTCNPSYSGSRDQEDCGSKPTRANSSWETISKKATTKRAGRVVQGVGLEFKPQYQKKKKRGPVSLSLWISSSKVYRGTSGISIACLRPYFTLPTKPLEPFLTLRAKIWIHNLQIWAQLPNLRHRQW
jgi:hypothetical protein